jgi:hypothetical protein
MARLPAIVLLTLSIYGHMIRAPVDETRLHAVCFGPLASETYIRRFFIALSVGGMDFRVRYAP